MPRSLFSFDGKLIPCNDKSKLIRAANLAAKVPERSRIDEAASINNMKITIFDGMAWVNKIITKKDMQEVWNFGI